MSKESILNGFKQFILNNINDAKPADEMVNCLTWMRENWEIVEKYSDINYYHPALVYSRAINGLISNWNKSDDYKNKVLIDWLCSNKKYPFGMIDKIKAYRVIKRNTANLSKQFIFQLSSYLEVANGMKYRPREILYLEKVLDKVAQQGDAPEPDSCRSCLSDTTSRPGDL